MKLRDFDFATELKLPVDIATETLGFLGRKGRGKTYGAQKWFELLFSAGVQCVALDPVGNWWSVRVGKDGKSPGLKVYVFGGPHGDVPLLPDKGAYIAKVIVETGISVVLDVSRFRKAERKRFMTAFAEEFFHLKKDAPSPVHLFVEEAHVFCPQRPREGEEPMLGAMEDVVRIGRNYGIGVTLISQRAATVNKDVLSQVECLIAYQTSSAQDKKAIKEWIEENEDEDAIALLKELKSLARGEALFWSPSVLRKFLKIHVKEKTTLDASSTPKIGEKARKASKLASVDLDKIRESMQEVVDQAEANDVGALKRKVKQLETELAKKAPAAKVKEVKTKEVVIALPTKTVARVERFTERLLKAQDQLAQAQQTVVSEVGNLKTELQMALKKVEGTYATNLPKRLIPDAIAVAAQRQPKIGMPAIGAQKHPPVKNLFKERPPTNGEVKLDGPMLRVLGALTWFEGIGIAQPSTTAVAFMSKYSGENGAFNNVRGKLRTMGLVTYPTPGTMALTDEGRANAPASDVPPTGEGLRNAVLSVLDGPQKRVLEPLIQAYPNDLHVAQLAEEAGYGGENGAFNNVRGRLRTLGLATYPTPGHVRAADILFPG